MKRGAEKLNSMKTSRILRNEGGFTLIELIVAGVVAMLVVAGIIATMTMSQRGYFIQDRVSEAQQSARIGIDLLERDARMAGFGLVRGSTAFFEYGKATGGVWDDANTIDVRGDGSLMVNRDGTATPPSACSGGNCQTSWTDAIAIHRARGGGIGTKALSAGANLVLDTTDSDYPANGFCGGEGNCGTPPSFTDAPILFCISSAGQSYVIQLTTQMGNPGAYTDNSGLGINPPGGVDDSLLVNGTCYAADRLVYYVNVNRQLVISTNWSAPVVVANDIEDLQIAYRVESPTATTWEGTTSAPDLVASTDDKYVRMVRLSLIARVSSADPKFSGSLQSVVAPATALENHDLSAASSDNLRRRLLTSSVTVRNNGY